MGSGQDTTTGPAEGLPQSRIGTFTRSLCDEAVKRGWVVVGMRRDWKRVFGFE